MHSAIDGFISWQSSTWPDKLPSDGHELTLVIKRIFEGAIFAEINNVIEDAIIRTKNLDGRGFVVCVSMLCALDAISAYGYGGNSGGQIPEFIRVHFPKDYRPFAMNIKKLCRNNSVHGWNLYGAEIHAGNEEIKYRNNRLSFGLLNFFDALKFGTEDFLNQLAHTQELQKMARARYGQVLSFRRGRLGSEN